MKKGFKRKHIKPVQVQHAIKVLRPNGRKTTINKVQKVASEFVPSQEKLEKAWNDYKGRYKKKATKAKNEGKTVIPQFSKNQFDGLFNYSVAVLNNEVKQGKRKTSVTNTVIVNSIFEQNVAKQMTASQAKALVSMMKNNSNNNDESNIADTLGINLTELKKNGYKELIYGSTARAKDINNYLNHLYHDVYRGDYDLYEQDIWGSK